MDITQIVTGLIGLATTVITVIVAPWLLKQLKIADGKIDQQARDILYPALQYAISYGQAALTKDEQGKLDAEDGLKNQVVSVAASYVKAKLSDTLEHLGVTDDALQSLLRARLQNALDYLKIPAAK